MRRVVWIAMLFAGCTTDIASNPAYGCEADADCGPGARCDRGYCLPDDTACGEGCDAGPSDEDAGPLEDAGAVADAGPATTDSGMVGDDAGVPVPDGCTPAPETCANPGGDDDCNGAVDDVPGLGDTCAADALGACALGSLVCGATDLECTPSMPSEETCDGNDEDCDGAIDEEFDLDTDAANCGTCGVACGATQICTGGICCGAEQTACDGACRDLSSDNNNCGTCGNRCGAATGCCDGVCTLLSLGCG